MPKRSVGSRVALPEFHNHLHINIGSRFISTSIFQAKAPTGFNEWGLKIFLAGN